MKVKRTTLYVARSIRHPAFEGGPPIVADEYIVCTEKPPRKLRNTPRYKVLFAPYCARKVNGVYVHHECETLCEDGFKAAFPGLRVDGGECLKLAISYRVTKVKR